MSSPFRFEKKFIVQTPVAIFFESQIIVYG